MNTDTPEFQRLVDRMKTAAFVNANSAFLGSILCQLGDIIWDDQVETAETDGTKLRWNPNWFIELLEATRKSVLLHELWHVGRLHGIRGANRDPEDWNKACDIVINNDLMAEGCTFEGTQPLVDSRFIGMSEEQVYDLIHDPNKPSCPRPANGSGGGFSNDLLPTPVNQQQTALGNAVMAVQQAVAAKQAGNLPGSLTQVIDDFLNPVLPWERILWRFFEEMTEDDVSWRKRNRRYSDIYMPGHVKSEGGLSHLAYFLDVSGSISDYDVKRFNSEVKYVKEQFNPEKMTLILFDTKIQATYVYNEDDEFNKVVIIGRGGTSLECVRDWIEENQPTAALIFTDMECHPMQRPSTPIPVMWIKTGNNGHRPSFGEVIKIS